MSTGVCFLLLLLIFLTGALSSQQASSNPHIVYILIDDEGYGYMYIHDTIKMQAIHSNTPKIIAGLTFNFVIHANKHQM